MNQTGRGTNAAILEAWHKTITSSLALIVLGFATTLIAARGLGPDGRGILAAILLSATLVGELAQLGLAPAFVYGMRAYPGFPANATLMRCICLIAAVAAVTALISTHLIGGIVSSMQGTVVALTIGIALFSFLQNALQIDPSLKFYNAFRLLNAAGLVSILAALWSAGMLSATTALHAQAALLFTMALAAGVALFRFSAEHQPENRQGHPAHSAFARTLRYGGTYHVATLSGLMINNVDKIVLYFRGSIGELGAYAAAYAASRALTMLQQSISTTLFAHFAGADEKNLDRTTSFCFRVTFLPLLIVASITAVASPSLMRILFGSAYIMVAPAFAVLLIESVVGGASWVLAQRFHASGRPMAVVARQLPSLLTILIATPFLPPENLTLWIALTVLAASLIRLILSLAMYKLILHQPVPALLPTGEDFKRARKMFLHRAVRSS